MKDIISKDVRTVWDYMLMNHKPCDADCMIVLGSRDDRVAECAAKLASTYAFSNIIITGGVAHGHDLLQTAWTEASEAEHFEAVMRLHGYNGEVLLEKEATNTGENALFSAQLLRRRWVGDPRSILIVTKPYMERRALATFETQWPHTTTRMMVTSPLQKLEDYISDELSYDDIVNIMVGDLERIMEYPKSGFQSFQEVPNRVHEAWLRLVTAGYNKHLLTR